MSAASSTLAHSPIPTDHADRYGRIEGVHCAENPMLLQDILRKEWGFDGIVMSDWCANPSHLMHGTQHF